MESGLAAEHDFAGIYQLLEQLWPNQELNQARIQQVFIKALHTGQPSYFVAKQHGKIVGFISCLVKNNLWAQGNLLHIDDLIIDEEYRRQQIGSMLIQAARDFARENCCTYLELDSGFPRTGAHFFYEKNGFTKRAFNFIYQLD